MCLLQRKTVRVNACFSVLYFQKNFRISAYIPPKASSGQEEDQKIFWSLCNYMVRSCHGIEMQINLINISYCAVIRD